MRADLIIKGKSLTGSSDLTLLAPLRAGLASSLEAVTYKTRTQRLLTLLNGGRAASHEYAMQRPISDSVERVARIHSFRVAVLEPEDKVLLAVTFDGTWESYIRVLWQKVGTLLDIIFCNTDGYVLSLEGFDAWTAWVRRVQVESGFFFNTHALTVDDVRYLRQHEYIHRSASDAHEATLETVGLSARSAESLAYEAGQTTPSNALETLRQGLQSLALLFRLTDLYLPGTPDGDVLLRAARDLLCEFIPLIDDPDFDHDLLTAIRARFDRQLTWLLAADRPSVTQRRLVPPLTAAETETVDLKDIQGGMLAGYDEATHGCLLLLAFRSSGDASKFLGALRPFLTSAQDATFDDPTHPLRGAHKTGGPFYNVSVTFEGLRRLGLTEAELADWLPEEFRQGMEERASMLGDFRANHPRRWSLPSTSWGTSARRRPTEVQMSAVEMVVQIRAKKDLTCSDDPSREDYALREEIIRVVGSPADPREGVYVLAVQPMKRLRNDREQVIEHFGFADGGSQPEFATGRTGGNASDPVQLGELLLGFANDADPAPTGTPESAARLRFLRNGSFMVVRKLRQDVTELRRVVAAASDRLDLDPGAVLAKMMGRWQGGSALSLWPDAPQPSGETVKNDFDFDADPRGARCPLHSHIRRANPRLSLGAGEPPGRRRPRLVRRGMSYGDKASVLPGDATSSQAPADDRVDRGLVFIAYNASISEQFEVVQRWLTGGNSTGGFSGHSDPFLGVPEPGQQRFFQFEAKSSKGPRVCNVALDASPPAFEAPRPLVRLQWGLYLFVPSLNTLRMLEERSSGDAPAPAWDIDKGERMLVELEQLRSQKGDICARDAWKAAVEDPQAHESLRGAALWASIRHRGGALRTPYGVLVATGALVDEVLGDDRRFSVSGYRERMIASRFDIFLGLDDGSRYRELSTPVIEAIMSMTKADAFTLAAVTAESALRAMVCGERRGAAVLHAPRWELNLDAKEIVDLVLQRLCQEWLGLPASRGGPIEPGSWRWDWSEGKPSVYPGHFTPPSRYFFQPRPGDDVRRFGERYGAALAEALAAFIKPYRENGTVPLAPSGQPAPLAEAILAAGRQEDLATLARTFAGVLMGFLPTLDGNVRLVLNEWLRLKTFWKLRAVWARDSRAFDLAKAEDLLEPEMRAAMQFRPSPELIWRTVQREVDSIGNVPLERGDVVVVALVSATQEALSEGSDDVISIFGGDRRSEQPPTHACPGYSAAMGVMLGVLAAFIDAEETLRPSPAPLAFTLEGEMP